MESSVLRQTPRTEDDACPFAVRALPLAGALAIGASTLMAGAMSTDRVPAAAAPVSKLLSTFVGARVSTPRHLSDAMRRLVVVAALVLLPLAVAAQNPSVAEQERAYAAAQAEYEVGHYAAAFTGFAALADAGHVESARIAVQMQRSGPGLYQMRFAAGPKQITRWTALVSCRSHAAAATDACLSVAGGEASQRR